MSSNHIDIGICIEEADGEICCTGRAGIVAAEPPQNVAARFRGRMVQAPAGTWLRIVVLFNMDLNVVGGLLLQLNQARS